MISGLRIAGTQLSDPGPDGARKPLVVVGPSLGTSVAALWSAAAQHLADRFHVVGWDLPGHGASPPVLDGPLDLARVASGVLELVDAVQAERGEAAGPFCYAGDSAGGAVGLQLLVAAPDRVAAAVILCSSAAFGAMDGWTERAATVRGSGTPAVVELSARRWFAGGFLDHEPGRGAALLRSLQETDAESYAQVCEALDAFDVRDRLAEVAAPVLAVGGSEDVATPPEHLEEIAAGVQHGRLVVLDGVAHQAPAESPSMVAKLLAQHFEDAVAAPTGKGVGEQEVVDAGGGAREAEPATGIPASEPPSDPLYDQGMAVRREVLGEAHVDRAGAAVTDLTREFQELITRYAWGTIWTRPGLDRRSRSMITLTALIARGHHEELAMHLRAARRNGLSDDEIKEVILQSAVYCGVPDANTAFRVAQQVLAEPVHDQEET